jgi:hypothetical protein
MEKLPQGKNWGGSTIRYTLMGYIYQMFGISKKGRPSPDVIEQERFSKDAKEQLVSLKRKGLSIPVFTL